MTLKIGHRGACGYAPENTMASFRKALALGADGVECDVHVCKSGEPVVIHDATLKRTTGISGRVRNFTLKELHKLGVPSLKELLEEIAPKAIVFIEIKDSNAVSGVAKLVTTLAERIGYANMPVISFKPAHLRKIKKLNPRILIGATPEARKSALTRAFIARAKKDGMFSVNPCIDFVTRDFVEHAHANGLKVITWTANTKRQIEKAKKLGIDGIVSDYPDRIPA